MDSTSSNETIYELYKNAHFTWNIAFWAFLLNLIAFFGICLNLSVIWVTFKTKTLHGTANFNLALGCLFEVFHQFGHLLFLFTAFSGQNFLPYPRAVQICTIPLFGLGSVALSIALTALDRLLYVIFPLRTFMVKPTSYLTIITIICLCFSLQNVFIFYKTAEAFPNLMITGSMDEILSAEPGKEIYNYISLSLNALTLIIYIALGILLKIKRANISAMNDSGRIYRSILVLITVRLSGFFAMRIFRLYIAHGIWPFMTRWCISQTMSILLNMSTASTGPILYGTSSDYRAAFLKEFNLVLRLLKCHRGSRVHTITTFPQSIVGTENVMASVQGISILHKSPRSPSWQITERRRLASAYR